MPQVNEFSWFKFSFIYFSLFFILYVSYFFFINNFKIFTVNDNLMYQFYFLI